MTKTPQETRSLHQTNSTPRNAPTRLLKPEEAAAFLAISRKTLKRLVAQGDVRAKRVSRSMRFELADLQAFIGRNPW